ncbi:MAG: hypothetical protein C0483_19315 [Pirellula sp.]|nr:hypothetical protein [Pirellula sp.]
MTRIALKSSKTASQRRDGLTLLELVVVLAILVVLAGLIVPIISGLGYQTNAATNATVADDVSRAVRTYYGRFDAQPTGWDSLLNTSGASFGKLHSLLPPLLATPIELTPVQAQSLTEAGIYGVYDADESLAANVAHATPRPLAAGGKVQVLSRTNAATLLREAFGLNTGHPDLLANNEFVVLGLGAFSNMRGSAIAEVPLVQSADPTHHYARVLCVYMIPSSTAAAQDKFPATFLGCVLPDGTSRTANIEQYNNSRDADS